MITILTSLALSLGFQGAPAQEPKTLIETAQAAGRFSTLLTAVEAAGLVETLSGKGPFTVFAPTDEAFAALPAGTLDMLLKKENRELLRTVLTYHVASGSVLAKDAVAVAKKGGSVTTVAGQRLSVQALKSGVKVGEGNVVTADIVCSNGVIHVVDKVLLPSLQNVVELAVAAGQFKSLAKAIETAGLVEALRAPGPFTVFAPNDAAFAALPAGTVENLLKPESRDQLVAILKLHVVSGRMFADQVVAAKELTTLQGKTLAVVASEAGVTVGGAQVLKTDLQARNGVIHVIDRVLLP